MPGDEVTPRELHASINSALTDNSELLKDIGREALIGWAKENGTALTEACRKAVTERLPDLYDNRIFLNSLVIPDEVWEQINQNFIAAAEFYGIETIDFTGFPLSSVVGVMAIIGIILAFIAESTVTIAAVLILDKLFKLPVKKLEERFPSIANLTNNKNYDKPYTKEKRRKVAETVEKTVIPGDALSELKTISQKEVGNTVKGLISLAFKVAALQIFDVSGSPKENTEEEEQIEEAK